jgi:hypothetical protein
MGFRVSGTSLKAEQEKKARRELTDLDYKVIKAAEGLLLKEGLLDESFANERETLRARARGETPTEETPKKKSAKK